MAKSAAETALVAFLGYETPFSTGAPAPSRATPALSSKVVLVLVDGLGLGPSKEMPYLNELRGKGADVAVRIGLPSLSLPGRAVGMTGAWQEVNGQSTNKNPRPLRVEHIFGNAKRKGLRTLMAAGPGALTLFERGVTDPVVYVEAPETAPFEVYLADLEKQAGMIREAVAKSPAAFQYLEFHAVDESGHGWGATSEQYKKAAALVDVELAKIFALVDPSKTTLIVTADHGHVPEGGHGGPEEAVMQVPLVMVGKGVKAGYAGTAQQADIAPTIAALLGIDIPSSNQGETLVDALDVTPEQRRGLMSALVAQRETFVSSYVKFLLGPLGTRVRGARPAAPANADEGWWRAELMKLDAEADAAKKARMATEETVRSQRAAVVALVPVAILLLLLVSRAATVHEAAVAGMAAVVGHVLYVGLLRLLGLGYSFTAVNKDEWLDRFFLKDMAVGVGTCALAVALAALWMARREPHSTRWDFAGLSWLTASAFCFVFVLRIALVYWREGIVMRWRMLDQNWGFSFYLDALAIMAVGFVAIALPLVAFAVARFARPVEPAAAPSAAA